MRSGYATAAPAFQPASEVSGFPGTYGYPNQSSRSSQPSSRPQYVSSRSKIPVELFLIYA